MTLPLSTFVLIAICGAAGALAQLLGLPLPYMLGPLLASGLAATAIPHRLPAFPWLIELRLVFIAVIGLVIGTQVTPELFAQAHALMLSILALAVFVLLSVAWNYTVFRRLGRYDRATAFYSSAPGGLYESIAFGEAAGADASRLILQQFLRVIMVVTFLPIALSIWHGEAVGSAGGMSLAGEHVPLSRLPIIVLAVALGVGLGRFGRLPAGQLTGPLAIGALLSLTGLVQMEIPQWLVNLAQVVVGTALGMRFTGISPARLRQAAGLAVVSVGGMLALAALMASLMAPLTGEGFEVMLISFAPGGVTEMALVALSVPANPALVTLYHIIRILMTVLGLTLSARWLKSRL
ncbi:AbrB family transcriptional regulator [Roseovarius faecimaris]|uniref:AbrB family transcriptional regulator n=1 Tax=Roseovarius faecimaris TaxID=2494550 RepID=A0A6I6ISW5_9RHOB|nr:AbrB family transcriptional regulator [Roseovarius faecimaris]QGX98607.1 AbrB family transcriptional regulator [Roseovarius faecimaris]